MTSEHFFEYDHPVEGQLGFYRSGETIRMRCRWPLDRSFDDWITIDEEFDSLSYHRALQAVAAGAKAEVSGRLGGGFKPWKGEGGKYYIEVSNAGKGETFKSLLLTLDVPLLELYLSP